jgi:hypothetical protein
MVNKASNLATLNRVAQALEALDAVEQRFGKSIDPQIQQEVARALVNKARRLDAMNRGNEAQRVFASVVNRFGKVMHRGVRKQVDEARKLLL